MIAIILVSHGPFASAALSSITQFTDDLSQVEAVTLEPTDSPEAFHARLEEAITRHSSQEGVVVLTDIPGGTPSNRALMIAMTRSDVEVITGLNLILFLDAILKRRIVHSLHDLCVSIQNAGCESIMNLTQQARMPRATLSSDLDELR
jgi:N-acetylgalactosamine PTS system EIIA component